MAKTKIEQMTERVTETYRERLYKTRCGNCFYVQTFGLDGRLVCEFTCDDVKEYGHCDCYKEM